MHDPQQATPKISRAPNPKAITPLESFNYLNLEDSVLTRQSVDKPPSDQTASKPIIKIVHQISNQDSDDNDDRRSQDSVDMTSQILAEEIFSPIVW